MLEYIGNEGLKASFENVIGKGATLVNASSSMAFDALAGLRSNSVSWDDVIVIAIAACGNPKTKKGEPVMTLRACTSVKGGTALRQALDKVKKIWELCGKVEGVDDAIDAYLNKDKGAPRGIDGLRKQVFALQKAALGPAATASMDVEPSEETEVAPVAPLPAPPLPLAAHIEQAIAAIKAATGDELIEARHALAAMQAALDDCVQTVVDMAIAA